MKKTHRKIAREKAVFGVYQWLLLDASIEELELFLDSIDELNSDVDAREFAASLIYDIMSNFAGYRLDIAKYVKKGWTFERLSFLEKAILLVAVSEIKKGELQKQIIANEAVELAKKYCDDESYKFINGILTNIE